MKGILKKKQGISLIVLVITIIVIVILSVSVILTIANNNPIDNAREAVFKSDLKTMQEEVDLYILSDYVGRSNLNLAGDEMVAQFPSTEKYKEKVAIQNGKVVLVSSTAKEAEWANEIGITQRQTSVWGGTSTDTTWYNENSTTFNIYTAEQFVGFRDLVNAGTSFEDKTVKLVNNIDLGDVTWTPIGTEETPFYGTFDGDGNIIVAEYITFPENLSGCGIFGEAKNVIIQNLGVSYYECNYNNFGGIVGSLESGEIKDCYCTLYILRNCMLSGGIAAESTDSVIENCYVEASIDNNNESIGFGGIVYTSSGGEIKNCYTNINVDADVGAAEFAGIVFNGGSNVSNCYNLGDIEFFTNYYTEIAGIACSAKSITNCYNLGYIFVEAEHPDKANCAGIGNASNISNCSNEKYVDLIGRNGVSMDNFIAGAITNNSSATVTNCKYKLVPSCFSYEDSSITGTVVDKGTLDASLTMPSVYDVVSTGSTSWVNNGDSLPTLAVFNK